MREADISLKTLLKSNVNILGTSMNIAGACLFLLFSLFLILFMYKSCSNEESFNIMNKYALVEENIRQNINEIKQVFNERKPILIKQDDKKKSDLDFFYNTEFNPLCCNKKNINFSSSDGCPCLSLKQKSTLITRGNNTS